MKRLFVAMLVVGSCAFIQTHSAGAATLVVDKDHVQCPNAQFASIEAAVLAAAPGDTVSVCPDLYTENVTVDKPLTILGPGAPKHPGKLNVCTDLQVPDPTEQAIVEGYPTTFVLDSGEVTLRGLVIQGLPGNAATGVRADAFDGVQIVDNLFQNNATHVFLATGGATESDVSGNCFRANRLAGAPFGGRGVFTQNAHNTVISDNTMYLVGLGVTLNGTESQISVDDNQALDGVQFVRTAAPSDSEISGNTVTGMSATAIGAGGLNVTIASNDIEGSGGDAIATGGTGVQILGNLLSGNGGSGIFAGPGVLQASTIANNTLRDNGRDGIQIEAGNMNNDIEHNKASGNGVFDCYDASVGAGTGGTANVWLYDLGDTENRPELCK